MSKLNEQIRLWNSICVCTATTNRITGKDSFCWPSLLLTMLRVLQRVFLRSSLIKVITPTLHSESIEYLSFQLSPGGLSMHPAKIQTIQDWPKPRKVNNIQKFLGFANFYHRFINNYSDIVIPLTRLTRKSNKWNFNDKC